MAHSLGVQSIVLDGEALALKEDGRPHPFQVSASRLGSRLDVARLRDRLPLTPFVFDILHLNGEDLIDRGLAERNVILTDTVPERWRVPRLVTADVDAAQAFVDDMVSGAGQAVLRGHGFLGPG